MQFWCKLQHTGTNGLKEPQLLLLCESYSYGSNHRLDWKASQIGGEHYDNQSIVVLKTPSVQAHLSLSCHSLFSHLSPFHFPHGLLGRHDSLKIFALYKTGEFMDDWKASCLALTAFRFIAPDKNPARVEILPIFARFLAPRANNVPASCRWPPSIRLHLDVSNFGRLRVLTVS